MTQPGDSSETIPRAIGIAGAGAMARMFVRAFAHVAEPPRIQLWARNVSAAQSVARDNDRAEPKPLSALAQGMDVVILATPATAYRELLERVTPTLDPQAIIVSLSNAMAIEEVEGYTLNPVMKVIPTIAHELKRGVSILVAGTRADQQAVAKIRCMMQAISTPVIAQDDDCRALSNLAGSGLAIAAKFARLCVAANEGAASSINREMLDAIMAETFAAVAALHVEGRSFETIIAETAVPGGMTEAAVSILKRDGSGVVEMMMQETFRRQALLRAQNISRA